MNAETYGQQVARLRKELGLTQQQLAEQSGVPKRTIQDVEGDKRGKPQRSTRLALNKALGIEGHAEAEREEWPDDVKVILDILGAYLMTMTPSERLAWMSEITPRVVGGR